MRNWSGLITEWDINKVGRITNPPINFLIINACSKMTAEEFCPKCGTLRRNLTSQFCGQCGAALPLIFFTSCPKCGTPRRNSNSQFCGQCGAAFDKTVQSQSPPPPEEKTDRIIQPDVRIAPKSSSKSSRHHDCLHILLKQG